MSQTEAEKRAQKRKDCYVKYFTEAPDPRDRTVARSLLALAIGASVAAAAIHQLWGAQVLALVPLFVAVVSGASGLDGLVGYRRQYDRSHPRPADKEMDRLLADELVRIRSVSLEKLGITSDELELTGEGWDPVAHLERGGPVLTHDERRPLVVFGPAEDAQHEVGRDQIRRFSAYRVMAICPTHFNLGLYLCTVNLLTGGRGHEETREYHYDDVVAVTTVTVGEQEPVAEVTLRGEEVRFARELLHDLRIVTSSGEGSRITVAVPLRDGSTRATLQSSGIDQVVASVRRVLRDRRGADSVERV